jgi:cell division septation protein DedD
MKVTSRNAGILAQAEINNPGGTIDFNRLHADANLQANPNFQQRGMVVDALPQMIQRMVDSGKKLSYPDLQVAGEAKKWMLGQSNDPDLAEYMAQRNDTLMNLASVMRGVGMSDQAHSAEIEAAAPTLSPRALEGWARGQMSAVMPRYAAMHRISDSHAAPAPGATPTPAAATPTPAAAPPTAPAAPAAPPAGKVLTPQEYLAQFGKH